MPRRSHCVFECDQFDILHRFPKPELASLERFLQWTEIVGEKVKDKTSDDIYTNYRICNHHFEERFFYPQSKRLAKTAYPTLNLGSFTSSSQDANRPNYQAEPIENQPMPQALPGCSSHVLNPNRMIKHKTEQVQSEPVQIPQGGVIPKTFSKQSQNEPALIPQGSFVPENDTLPCPEQAHNKPAHIAQDSNVLETFSWESQSEPVRISQDDPEYLDVDDGPSKLSMYYDDDTASVTAKSINSTGRHEGFHCDICNGDIVGFRYTCIQCSNLDLCCSCESRSAHAQHYMLRVPGPRPYNEIQTVLVRIRMHLMGDLDPVSAADLDNEDAISVKSYVKSENEEEVVQVDPLHEDILYKESRIFSPVSEGRLKNSDSEEVSQNNTSVQRQDESSNMNRDINQSSFVRMSDESESTSLSTAKRKLILGLSEFLKLKESNRIAKKLCVTPRTRMKEITTPINALPPKADVLNPVVKLSKLTSGDLLEQDQTAKKICVMLNTRKNEISRFITALPVKADVFNPVVKLSRLPQSALLTQGRSEFIQVRSLNILQNVMNTDER